MRDISIKTRMTHLRIIKLQPLGQAKIKLFMREKGPTSLLTNLRRWPTSSWTLRVHRAGGSANEFTLITWKIQTTGIAPYSQKSSSSSGFLPSRHGLSYHSLWFYVLSAHSLYHIYIAFWLHPNWASANTICGCSAWLNPWCINPGSVSSKAVQRARKSGAVPTEGASGGSCVARAAGGERCGKEGK